MTCADSGEKMFIDTHAHLYYRNLKEQLDDVVERARDSGIEKIICVGTDIQSSKTSIAISEQYPDVFASVGIHPHDAKDSPSDYLDQIRELASHSKVVALGEIGLDFYRNISPPDDQVEVFTKQLELAMNLDLPAIIHNRDADNSILDILEAVGYKRVVLHCFSSDMIMAHKALDMGARLSFTGIVTFGKNNTESVLGEVPLDSIMLETDCPFLAPVPKRGKLNEPANIPYIAQKIADIKAVPVETVAEITTATAHNFFKLS